MMGLSRLAEECRECPYVGKCKHKRIEAIGYLPDPVLEEAAQSALADAAALFMQKGEEK